MTFYLIGLGLDTKSLSIQALEAIKKSKLYLENYTVDFPYNIKELEELTKKKITELNRENTESEEILKQAKKQDIVLLVYGNPLSATTHIQLIITCKKQKIPYKIIHSESILIAIAETGLQLYKFGKTASMPKFQRNYEPSSFYDIILQNQQINAHTLLLTDIGLTLKQALEQLEQTAKSKNQQKQLEKNKLIICSNAGTNNSKIYYNTLNNLKKYANNIKLPFCIIIPSDLHFTEQEALDVLSEEI